jgi:hypothetical protein
MDAKLVVFLAVIGVCMAGIPREKGKFSDRVQFINSSISSSSSSSTFFSSLPPSSHFSFLLSYIFILAIVLSILALRFNQVFQ